MCGESIVNTSHDDPGRLNEVGLGDYWGGKHLSDEPVAPTALSALKRSLSSQSCLAGDFKSSLRPFFLINPADGLSE